MNTINFTLIFHFAELQTLAGDSRAFHLYYTTLSNEKNNLLHSILQTMFEITNERKNKIIHADTDKSIAIRTEMAVQNIHMKNEPHNQRTKLKTTKFKIPRKCTK